MDETALIFAWLTLSFLMGFFGALLVARKGSDWGFIDAPTERSSHIIPVPKGGGIGILFSFITGSLLWNIPLALWLPACLISSISLLGDYREISFRIRLCVHFVSAAVFVGLFFLGSFNYETSRELAWVLFFFGIFFVTMTANYYNFMDGINGIAGLTGTIAFLCLGFYGLIEKKDSHWVVMAFGIGLSCIGFLFMNFPRARVFMGDVGSILLGFLFASFVLKFSDSLGEFLGLSFFLFPFYMDELNTLIVRVKTGENLTKAHRRHIYQILANQAGIPHAIVSLIYGAIQVFMALFAWYVMGKSFIMLIVVLTFLSVVFLLSGMYIREYWER